MYKFLKIILIICISILLPSKGLAYSQSEPMLMDYYEATESGDIESIMEIIDVDYYNGTTPDAFTYEEYLEEMFKAFTISNQKISDISIMETLNFDLIFHTVEATITEKDTGEGKDSVQNMVAIVWDNGVDHKLGWIMTEQWYDHRLESELLNNMTMEIALQNLEKESIKTSFEEWNEHRPEDINLEENDFSNGVISSEEIAKAEKEWDSEEGVSGSSINPNVKGEMGTVKGNGEVPMGDDWEEKWDDFEKSDTFKDIKKEAENHDEWMKEQGYSDEEVDEYNERLKKNGLDGSSMDDNDGSSWKILIFVVLGVIGGFIIATVLKKRKR